MSRFVNNFFLHSIAVPFPRVYSRAVPTRFTVLGSGSGGNASYLETEQTRLLIDAGLSGRQIRLRLAQLGRSPETLDGILLTHEHTDHTQGLKALCAKLEIPVYCNRLTADELRFKMETRLDIRQFVTGEPFEIGDVVAETFPVPHDAQDPVGFHVKTADGGVGVLTDLGQATRLVLERVRGVSALFIEANYDLNLLQEDTRRPWAIKQRIMSRHGHLANTAAAEAVETLANGTLRHVTLGHLSRDCNTPEIAREAVAAKLGQAGIDSIRIDVSTQAEPTETVTL